MAGKNLVGLIFVLAFLPGATQAQFPTRKSGCDWVPGFHVSGLSWEEPWTGSPYPSSELVHGSAVFDDGTGPALYIGGTFAASDDDIHSRGLARWKDGKWSAVPGFVGVPAAHGVRALAVFDDGRGQALYVGTIAGLWRWDGESWFELAEANRRPVFALTVYNSALYVGGNRFFLDNSTQAPILRYDGRTWSPAGNLPLATVMTFGVHDAGGGSQLFAGGNFPGTGGSPPSYVVRFDGDNWVPVGSDLAQPVSELLSWNDGSGPKLYANSPIGEGASPVSRWNGSSWSSVGSGIGPVASLTAWNDGGGTALYAGGSAGPSDGVVSKWTPSGWVPAGNFDGPVSFLAGFDDGSGSALFAAGFFTHSGAEPLHGVAAWRSGDWTAMTGAPGGLGADRRFTSLASFDDGSGLGLIVSGPFKSLGDLAVERLAKWDGKAWSPFPAWPGSGKVFTFDGVEGPELYGFSDSVPPIDMRKWDGSSWLIQTQVDYVSAIAAYDDGNGKALYFGGFGGNIFTTAVNRWEGGSTFSAVGDLTSSGLRDLAVFDDGNGPALYAAGNNSVAKWDGSEWIETSSEFYDRVLSLAVFDDGNGPALYAGGSFDGWSGPFDHIAKWDGKTWTEVGGGVSDTVTQLVVFDDGAGEALYVLGSFVLAGGQIIPNLARWDGKTWTPVGTGTSISSLWRMTVFDDGSGPSLYFSGQFVARLGGHVAAHFARFCQPGVFADGFESGDLEAWSSP